MQFDWVDSFKADYSDSMIDLLSRLRDSKQFVGNDNLRIQISNCILRFDSLDEESVRVKCRALVDLNVWEWHILHLINSPRSKANIE